VAISEATGVDRVRMLQWVVAWTGLSATWHGESTDTGRAARAVTIQVGRTAEDLLRAM
jgi:streptomycin 6-kinase